MTMITITSTIVLGMLACTGWGAPKREELFWSQKSFTLVEAEQDSGLLIESFFNLTNEAKFLKDLEPNRDLTAVSYSLLQWIVGASASTTPSVPWHAKFNPLSQATVAGTANVSTVSIAVKHRAVLMIRKLHSIGTQEFELKDDLALPGDNSTPGVTAKRDRDWYSFVSTYKIEYPVQETSPGSGS